MIAAPLATVDIAVDLPASTATKQPRPDKPIFVTMKADRTLAIGNDPISRTGLAGSLDAITSSDRTKRLFVRADKTVPYGDVMTLMNDLRTAGYLKIALVGLESAGGTQSVGAPQ
jgi:TonB system transport protein ExbD (group 1)